jgi:DNA-binding NarL/FixJ family response regulator
MRSLIIDDNHQFLGAARDLLERQGIEIVGVASSSDEALRLAQELQPELALVDIDLGAERDFADLIAASPAVGFVAKSDLSAQALQETLAR